MSKLSGSEKRWMQKFFKDGVKSGKLSLKDCLHCWQSTPSSAFFESYINRLADCDLPSFLSEEWVLVTFSSSHLQRDTEVQFAKEEKLRRQRALKQKFLMINCPGGVSSNGVAAFN